MVVNLHSTFSTSHYHWLLQSCKLFPILHLKLYDPVQKWFRNWSANTQRVTSIELPKLGPPQAPKLSV
uniref:Uncharacterized protein n=1 Tax=Rhizophora mucronata TaxID=61149 RepID=A0A2P2QXY0_RHIMU